MTLSGRGARYNASLLVDANLDAGRADAPAILWADESLSYGALFATMCRSGRALAELGVAAGDRVLLVLDDHPIVPALFLGAIRIGAVPVPLNPFLDASAYSYFAENSGARVILTDPLRAPKLQAALMGRQAPTIRMAVTGGSVEDTESFDATAATAVPSLDPADTSADDTAFWLYSSGSTGPPKAVVHRQDHLLATCETYARHILDIGPTDITFSTTKLFHAYGLGNNLSFPYWAGAATVLLSGRPTPDAIFAAIARFRPTLFFSVPTLYNALLKTEGALGQDLSSVRLAVSAAEALPGAVWQAWKDAFGQSILDGVGSTEMLHIYCSNRRDDVRPGSSGRPVPGYTLRVVREDGEPAPAGEAGTLWVKGATAFPGYWNQTVKTARVLQDGWFMTGDRYRQDSDGYFWYEGRTDDMFKVHGLWVSPVEVEAALMEHPAVLEAAVVGIPVEGFVEGRAFVIPRDRGAGGDVLERALLAHCERRLPGFQRPRRVVFVDDLPRTATGKIQRFKLRQPAASGS